MRTELLPLTARPAWKALEAHYEKVRELHLRTLFADDPTRGERLTADAVGIHLDYSKNRVTDDTLALLCHLATESGLRERIDAMFRGDKINLTEDRAVLHVALRAPRGTSIVVDGKDVVREVHAVLGVMADFSNRVRSGAWKGHTGKRIRNVVNIGIGGSDLGPVMAYEALKHYSDRALTFRFVSNIDGTDLAEATADLDPAETLVIVSSPSRRTPRRCRSSESTPQTCSDSGTGWADATRWTRRSVCRRCSPSVLRISELFWTASTRWTSTSAPPRSSATCRCSWAC